MIDYTNPNDPWLHTVYNPYKGMNDKERMKAGCLQGVAFIVMLFLILLLCALLGSCTTERVVTVERVRTDTVRVNRTAHDSIYVQDSVHIREKGDTVLIERWKTVWRNHTAHDSIYIHKVDSVPVPYPVIKEVEKPRTAFEKGMMATGGLAVMALVVVVVLRVRRFLP